MVLVYVVYWCFVLVLALLFGDFGFGCFVLPDDLLWVMVCLGCLIIVVDLFVVWWLIFVVT